MVINQHELVWHFTRAAGLEKILASGALHASLANEMNDASEVTYGQQKLFSAWQVHRQDPDVEAKYAHYARLFAEPPRALHAISACKTWDSFPHWIQYAQRGGYALGLDPSVPLGPFNTDETATWEDVDYSSDRAYNFMDKHRSVNLEEAFPMIQREGQLMKAPGFHYEAEVRLLLQTTHSFDRGDRKVVAATGPDGSLPIRMIYCAPINDLPTHSQRMASVSATEYVRALIARFMPTAAVAVEAYEAPIRL